MLLKKTAVDRVTGALVTIDVVSLKKYGSAKVLLDNQAGIALPSAEEQAELDGRMGELKVRDPPTPG